MEPKPQKDSEAPDSSETPPPPSSSSSQDHHLPIPPFTSITLSLSTLLSLPTHPKPKISPKILKIPNQISSLKSTLSLSKTLTPKPTPQHFSSKSTTLSPTPLHHPLPLPPAAPPTPTTPPPSAAPPSSAPNHRQQRVHLGPPRLLLRPAGLRKVLVRTGPYRANFLIESVSNLRKNLQARGSDLIVRIGRPESVLTELVKAVGAEAVYAHREVSHDEVKSEEKIDVKLKDEGVEVKYFWGSTLYHVDDLPFKLEEMPTNYGGFREKVQGLKIRKTIDALDQLRGLPAGGDVEAGEIPSLVDLGLNPTATMTQAKASANVSLVGGESEALERLKKFAAECKAQPNKDGNNDSSVYGANFSCKISPWLAMGCLSPRSMFDELKKSASRTISAASAKQKDGGDSGMNWLIFITKKYSSAKQHNGAPVTACTGVAA
ncbi:hypothetical protein OSB04_022824 [Centaurea solstitialis]|uniref:Photolyase/cryptochrome alpha/beta domain-containing protein n=1 Tax=Centaurea solstitialis TaxID=347529 RepID=A0AA38T1H9_9ASTR|nr:hypothetical protein OSB04_022824 [Centaurea solstitialis]